MSEIRKWSGYAPTIDAVVVSCPDCGAPVIDNPVQWEAHRMRVHQRRLQLTRLATTVSYEEIKKPRLNEEESILCVACRSGNHLACDGDDCRCVCALELDEPIRKVQRR